MHLIVEASDKRALSSGIRSVAIRIALYVNELVSRRGRVWADRWFGRELTSPRQVRNTLVYVLANFRKHAGWALPPGIDPFSSGASFDGFREWRPSTPGSRPRGDSEIPWAGRAPPPHSRSGEAEVDADWLVRPARAWLTGVGWRRHRLIGLGEAPTM